MENINRVDAEVHLNYNEEDLYELLVPQHVRKQAYTKEGLIARGRAIFVSRIGQLREVICQHYSKRGTNVKSSIDLTVLVGSTLLGAPAMLGIPVLPMAALIVKIGLEEICYSNSKK